MAPVNAKYPGECKDDYAIIDNEIDRIARNFNMKNQQRTSELNDLAKKVADMHKADPKCWEASHEHHKDYDLFYAEFDDQGNAADVAIGKTYAESQERRIKVWLDGEIKKQEENKSGLILVVFTHGWHGSALAEDGYSLQFKGMLLDLQRRQNSYASGKGVEALKVVGIEISWRGDSFENPTLIYPGSQNALNVWDRKLAAETVSTGDVQDLFAYLNDFYLDHSCHVPINNAGASQKIQNNDDVRPWPRADHPCSVHMLTLGHSFGALIDFRSLEPRFYSGTNTHRCARAYGFGDLTVFLNPAFEGARYRSLFDSAVFRPQSEWSGPYLGAVTGCGDLDEVQQIPTVVTLQSKGDVATGDFFPLFRHVTTLFEHTQGDFEHNEKIDAIGWVPAFRTHTLDVATTSAQTIDICGPRDAKMYCPFGHGSDTRESERTQTLSLQFAPGQSNGALPPYMPLWSVFVSEQLMADHDDFWNPEIVRFIDILFQDAYEQSETIHGKAAASVASRQN